MKFKILSYLREMPKKFEQSIVACVCVEVFVWPVAVDITMMISDRVGIPQLVRGTLLGTSTIIQCYPHVRPFLYPLPEDARGCQRVPARCPRS